MFSYFLLYDEINLMISLSFHDVIIAMVLLHGILGDAITKPGDHVTKSLSCDKVSQPQIGRRQSILWD